ncbi:MAG: trypsin-like serine protease [Desulfobulbaceae bacterium]|nr:trypsin-like serine protease [Desulfobulbaceae bacterium]
MHCPKCSHEQKNSMECEACGLIFEKFRKVQDRKKKEKVLRAERAESAENVEKSGTGLKVFQAIILVIVVAASTYYFTGYRQQEKVNQIADIPPVNSQVPVVEQQEPPEEVAQSQVSPQPVMNRQNAIERARNATVSIETPWGTGSGFFVNKNYIVTNRHVVEFDEKKLADFKRSIETSRRMIELEQQKISEMKRTFRQMRKGPSRSQLGIIIASREEELKRVLPQLEEGERRLAKLDRKVRPSDIKIVLNDGSEHFANYLLVSETSDLALMSLYAGDWKYIERPPKHTAMQQGDKVYTIGSPVGLRNTVTAGIFSGYRQQEADGQVYLQTDAAINPGNSGGPLIDELGFARGVNTMILRNTEGIGFAIPIAKVFEEFSSALY